MKRRILGLDVGIGSVGWALVDLDWAIRDGSIVGLGSRILPMDQSEISDFEQGNLQSRAAARTMIRGRRRMIARYQKRRERLLRVLRCMGFVDDDFEVSGRNTIAYIGIDEERRFAFMDEYEEMMREFAEEHAGIRNVSHDWTIYYLRKKALKEKISRRALAWIILQFNQKRGYYQLRGDDTLDTDAHKYFVSDTVVDIVDTEEIIRGRTKYLIYLSEGLVGEYSSAEYPRFLGKSVEWIVTEKQTKSGLSILLSVPRDDDWTLRKKRTEHQLSDSGLTVGEYIYANILSDPRIKIRGKEVHTIDRHLYRTELLAILTQQMQYHPELSDSDMLKKVAKKLYKRNKAHRKSLISRSMIDLIVDDVIYYHRPLKTKKHLIQNCKYESYTYKRGKEWHRIPVKGIAKSHPLYQELRIWKFLHDLKVYEIDYKDAHGVLHPEIDRTGQLLTDESKVKLFDFLNQRNEATQIQILKAIGLKDYKKYRWNYEADRKIEGNQTVAAILLATKGCEQKDWLVSKLKKPKYTDRLWHALYSLSVNEAHLRTALSHERLSLDSELIDALVTGVQPFKKDYGAYSHKAVKKLLGLMRCGVYWSKKNIDKATRRRIKDIINGEENLDIPDQVRDVIQSLDRPLKELSDFSGQREHLASYVVYGYHSEARDIRIYESPDDIDVSKLIPQNSLRNPTVEKVLRETMLIVRDIWRKYGDIDEIHLEMARELKLPAKKRKEYVQRRNANRATNERAKVMLRELKKQYTEVNPYSKGHLERFKLYEEQAHGMSSDEDKQIQAIRRKGDPTPSEIKKYRLWLEQRCRSPYTGQPIPLSKLFNGRDYDVDHIIPQKLYYDDSQSNKVICEKWINNSSKGAQTAYRWICDGQSKEALSKEHYEDFVNKTFAYNSKKRTYLLSIDPPKKFANRQLNNTQYIAKKLLTLLDPVVREERERGSISKNLLVLAGRVTHQLRGHWGLHDKWKELLAPRFKRMNDIHKTDEFYEKENNQIHLSGYDTELKRLDHRHHALDALIIACCTHQHVMYVNTLNNEKDRKGLRNKLMITKGNDRKYISPWDDIASDAYDSLRNVIISYKNTFRTLNRSVNFYEKYTKENGKWRKQYVRQKNSPDYWAVRKPMHKDGVYGRITERKYREVTLINALDNHMGIADSRIKKIIIKRLNEVEGNVDKLKKNLKKNSLQVGGEVIKKVNVIYYDDNISTKRIPLGPDMTTKTVKKVVCRQLQKDLMEHLANYNDDPKLAFSSDGIIEFNKERDVPVYRLKLKESLGKKYAIGEDNTEKPKYVEAAKGTNLYYVIYIDDQTGDYHVSEQSTLGLHEVIACQKEDLPISHNRDGYSWFTLSPGDLVYVIPEGEEKRLPDKIDSSEIYKCVSFTGIQCMFAPHHIATVILGKKELGPLNKAERAIDGTMIKKSFVKIKVDRLGDLM